MFNGLCFFADPGTSEIRMACAKMLFWFCLLTEAASQMTYLV